MSDESALSRREMMTLMGTAAVLPLASACTSSAPTSSSNATTTADLKDPLIHSSASSLARAIQAKQVSSVEVVQAHLDRIEEVNPQLNAVVQIAAERALEEAREADAALARGEVKGPLHGVPMTFKDSLETEGIVSTAGLLGRKDYVPTEDAVVVARMRAAGAIVLGKTNTPAMIWGGETNNLVYGRTNNPYDVTKTPGGSSGGAGAIVASAGSPLDIGSDTTGSVRGPAHFCGIAGLKPSVGRVPRTGHIVSFATGSYDSWTQLGPLARYVEDLVLTLGIISGPDWRDPTVSDVPLGDPNQIDLSTLRVAYYTDNEIETPTDDVVQSVERTAAAMTGAVLSLEDSRPMGVERAREIPDAMFEAVDLELTSRLLKNAGASEGDFLPPIREFLESLRRGPQASASDLDTLIVQMDQYRSEMLSFMEHFDVILCPPVAYPALAHGLGSEPEYPGGNYMGAYSITGWPAAVVRAGTSEDGMPIGVQIVGRPWRDDVVLAVAQFLEDELGGWQPPVI